MHCFSENLDFANRCLSFSPSAKISFSWIVSFNSAKDIQETAKNIPLKNILAETDSPYLTPVPKRWKEENEPSFTKYVIDKIVDLRDEKEEVVREQIFINSLEVFGL
jgi:TatD DNase family protein